ncbi:Putative nuclear protein DGCR14/ESS-2 [Septoria linicola]|uniref:Nuclear protein DGCR14/ESS-2 n=1 Tax=Septoria linicola TaxID=215465 RepID=A0A9Q9AQA9_9PEZI|nr:Putative nuclear protein DGCR14/ESS-2 [Septoria linicola]
MEGSQSQALAKRNSDTALMPPPPATKRQKRPAKVLDEDVYSDALSHIIARDFFPGLVESEAQQDYLQALDSSNREWIRESGRKLTQVMTPLPEGRRRMGTGTSFTPRRSAPVGDTPRGYVGQTPGQTPVDGNHFAPEEEKPEVDVNMSLGAFQAKYTSEDNESFNALLDKQNEKRASRYTFFQHGNKIPTARQIAYREQEQKLIETGQASRALVTTNSAGEQRLALAALRPSQDLDARPASVDSFTDRQGPRNTFMFGPDSVEDQLVTRAQEAEMRSNAPLKAINHGGTRLTGPNGLEAEQLVPPSPSMSAIDAAIAGRPRATDSETGYSGAETPRVNGYAFVDAEPTPSELGLPGADEDADAAEEEAAKLLLPKVEAGGPNPFHIQDHSKREGVHHRLVEKADAGRRKGGRMDQLRSLGITPGRTPTPKFASSASIRKGGMTPAAQALANRIGTPRREGGMFPAPGNPSGSWTPTPRVKQQK